MRYSTCQEYFERVKGLVVAYGWNFTFFPAEPEDLECLDGFYSVDIGEDLVRRCMERGYV
jgi:hypothetical protein